MWFVWILRARADICHMGCIDYLYARAQGWGKSIDAMRQIQDARDRGVDVVADVYPRARTHRV